MPGKPLSPKLGGIGLKSKYQFVFVKVGNESMSANIVDDIKSRLNVEDVIGSYVNLRKSGSYFKALSPFQAEKTPSFVVTPSKQIWKDFSSGRGGDIFSFVQEIEGVDFAGSIEILAAKAGLNPADYRRRPHDPAQAQKLKNMRKLLEDTADFYQQKLLRAIIDGDPVAKYYKQRGLNRETCINFRVGYAPAGWQQLVDYLAKRKIAPDLAIEAGLIKKTQAGRLRDQFVDRLIVPLLDAQGGVIGFTGRLIDSDQPGPKYINSPQTPLYNKSQHVFGYSQAKSEIGRSGTAVVVEGNLDVLMAHQAGYRTVVAAGGTALTADHFKTISRLAKEIRLAFDGDKAGIKATEKAISLVAQTASTLMVIPLPIGRDPDDLIRRDPDLWQQLYDSPQPALDWLYEQYKSQLDLKTAGGKRRLTDIMLAVVGHLNDPVEVDHYLAKLTEIGSQRQAIDKKYETVRSRILAERQKAKATPKPAPRPDARPNQPTRSITQSTQTPPDRPRPKPLSYHERRAKAMLQLLTGNPDLVNQISLRRLETLKLALKPELAAGHRLLVDYRHCLAKDHTSSEKAKQELSTKIGRFHQDVFSGRQAGATADELNKDSLWLDLEKRAASLSK